MRGTIAFDSIEGELEINAYSYDRISYKLDGRSVDENSAIQWYKQSVKSFPENSKNFIESLISSSESLDIFNFCKLDGDLYSNEIIAKAFVIKDFDNNIEKINVDMSLDNSPIIYERGIPYNIRINEINFRTDIELSEKYILENMKAFENDHVRFINIESNSFIPTKDVFKMFPNVEKINGISRDQAEKTAEMINVIKENLYNGDEKTAGISLKSIECSDLFIININNKDIGTCLVINDEIKNIEIDPQYEEQLEFDGREFYISSKNGFDNIEHSEKSAFDFEEII